MLIGGHVSTRGGIDRAVDVAVSIGATVIQTHPSQPQTWRPLTIDEATAGALREKSAAAGLAGHWFHAVYLINLASADEALLGKSVGSLVHYMDLAQRLGADGVVFHPGSHKGAGFEAMLPTIGASIREVLTRSSSPARLLVENSAGQGGCVGCRFEEVGAILDIAGDDERLGVCLDTCHSFASGYELRTADGVDATVEEFARHVGFDRLALVHANDSVVELGANRDRHANIGEGCIGAAGFARLLEDPRLRAVPWILEVPGDGQGPD
ncbi:MAG TPA: deoxyribonuclease IV, partial [Candidatus Dormibacteraeota bacterium]|nr:deoxyribonuclease IV [Candidatus Dormibacteraeota bacterium]